MAEKNVEKHNNHYVSQAQQREWAFQKRIYYYNKNSLELLPYKTSKSVMYGKDYYKLNESSNELELFFKWFEDHWHQNIGAIRTLTFSDIQAKSYVDLNTDWLISFLAVQKIRVSENVEPTIATASDFYKSISDIDMEINLLNITQELKNQLLNNENIKVEALHKFEIVKTEEKERRNMWLQYLPYLARKQYDEYSKSRRILFYAAEGQFILTDNPVLQLYYDENTPAMDFFPLTPNWCLCVMDMPHSTEMLELILMKNDFVKRLNELMRKNANKYLVCHGGDIEKYLP
jgi:hypothetical protein